MGEMIDPELVQAALCFAVTFAACEIVVVIAGAALAWLFADCLKG